MKEVKIVLRKDRVDPVVHALAAADVPRFHVSHVHVLGAGVDPDDARLSRVASSTSCAALAATTGSIPCTPGPHPR